jgi:hypothetical protein
LASSVSQLLAVLGNLKYLNYISISLDIFIIFIGHVGFELRTYTAVFPAPVQVFLRILSSLLKMSTYYLKVKRVLTALQLTNFAIKVRLPPYSLKLTLEM